MIKKAIVIAGVSGCGKSTLGLALANQLGWSFIEADEFHSQAAKSKMIASEPLNDSERTPWLATLNAELLRRAPAVLACSALKQSYRDRLARGLSVEYVWIDISRELAESRVFARENHFMPASLVSSQFETAEIPREATRLSAAESLDESLRYCTRALEEFISQ